MPAATYYKIYVSKSNGGNVTKTWKLKWLEGGLMDSFHTSVTSTWNPGTTKSEKLNLNELYDLSAPGTYLVRLSGGYQYSVLSNLIRVTITQ